MRIYLEVGTRRTFFLGRCTDCDIKNELELNDFESIRNSKNVNLFEIVFKDAGALF